MEAPKEMGTGLSELEVLRNNDCIAMFLLENRSILESPFGSDQTLPPFQSSDRPVSRHDRIVKRYSSRRDEQMRAIAPRQPHLAMVASVPS